MIIYVLFYVKSKVCKKYNNIWILIFNLLIHIKLKQKNDKKK
jgi:hypothetical protein